MKQSFKICSLTAALAAIFLFSTCQIGLGSVVDTHVPELSIAYPPESSVIKEQFVITGTCSDDIGVKEVLVKVTNTDTKTSYGPFNAELAETGTTWTITLNKAGSYNGYEYCDGRYNVEIYAKDKSGRKSATSSLSFDIDNTAPVLYLSKPLSKGDDSELTTFGKQVKVTGEISENHTTAGMLVRFAEWDAENNQISEEQQISIEQNIEISADTPLMIARYYTESECDGDENKQKLRENYLKFYPTADTEENPADKTFYCTFELVDNAKIYQNPGDSGTGEGNKSTRYFINSVDFANSLVSDTTYSLTVENMKKLINGTSSYTAGQQKAINEIISNNAGFYVDSSTTTVLASKFLLNPDNNPTYKVEGYSIDDGNSRNTLNTDSSLSISFNCGKDSTYLKTKSIAISVISEEKDASGNPAFTKTYVCPSTTETLPAGAEYWSDSDDETLSKSIKIGKADGYVSGSAYKIVVTGTDRDSNQIYAANGANGYGFILSSLALPPTVTLDDDSLSGKYYSVEDIKAGIEIPFTVTTDSVNLYDSSLNQNLENGIFIQADQSNSGFAVVRANMEDELTGLVSKDNSSAYPATLKVTKPAACTQSGYNYSMSIKVGGDDASVNFGDETGVFKYSFYILALDANNKTGSANFVFYVDNQKPEISGESISLSEKTVKCASKTGDDTNSWLNGTVYITEKLHDNYGIQNSRCWIYAHSSAGDELVSGGTEGLDLGKAEEFTIDVDTTAAQFEPVDNGDGTYEYKQLKFKLMVKDTVGNQTDYESTFGNTYIDQETDKPVVTPGNFVFGVTSKDDIKTGGKNIIGSGTKLIGKISDDDGIAEASVLTIKKLDSDGNKTAVEGFDPVKLNTAENFNISLPSASGYYSIDVLAQDTTYDAATDAAVKAYRTTSYSTLIAIDSSYPSFDEVSVGTSDTQYLNGGQVQFLFTISDDIGFPENDYLTAAVSKNGTAVAEYAASITTKNAAGQYTYTFDFDTVDEATYDFEFVAKDLSGKTVTINRAICKDVTPPDFGSETNTKPRIVTIPSGSVTSDSTTTYWYNTQTLQIKGTASDNASGVSQVMYKIGSAGIWKNAAGTTSFEETISGLKHGNQIFLKAKDGAGNETAETSLPVIHLDNLKPELSSNITADVLTNGTEALPVSGKVNDSTDSENIYGSSGIKQINLKCGTSDFTTPDLTINVSTSDSTSADWSGKIPAAKLKAAFASEESGKIYGQAVDNAGNTYETAVVTVKYDAQYPEAKITSVTYFGTENTVTQANKKIVIKGTAQDNNQLKSIKLQYTESPETSTSTWTDYGSEITTDIFSWSYTVNTEDTYIKDGTTYPYFTDGTTYVFRAVASDKAGNIGNSGTTTTAYSTANSKTVAINQSSDFPVVTVSNLAFDSGKSITTMSAENHGHIYNTTKLYISYSDDDGISKIEYKSGNGWYNADSKVTYYTLSAVPAVDDYVYTDSGCITKAKNGETELKVSAYNTTTKAITVDSKAYTSNDSSAWKEITGDNISITTDGPHIIMFRVTDVAGTTFTSNSSTANVMLKDLDGNVVQKTVSEKSVTSDDTRIFVDVDNAGPVINESNTKYASATGSASAYTYGEWNSDSSNVKFGGLYKAFKLSVTIRDPNGVKSAYLWYNGAILKAFSCEDTSYSDGTEHTWTVEDIDISSYGTARTQFVLKTEDNAGNTSESNIAINIDNTPATLGIDSHKEGEQVSTAFILKGYLTDSDSETTVKYYTDAASTVSSNHDWTSDGEVTVTSGSVRLNVDGKTSSDDNETHTVSHKQLFVNAYGTSKNIELSSDGYVVDKTTKEKFLKVLPLYFHFLVTDKCGNTSTTNFQLQVDPQGDIPTVEITYPVYPKAGTTGDLDLFSGKVRAQGKATAKGDNSIVAVYMQIDPVVDSTTPSFDASDWTGDSLDTVKAKILCPDGTKLSAKLSSDTPIENIYTRYNDLTGVTAKTSPMYGIYVGNTAAWNFTLNASGELESSGQNTIGIRMYVVDSAGNISVTNRENDVFITLDSNAPQIGSDIPLYVYQYKWVRTSDNTVYYSNKKKPAAGAQLYTDSGCRTAATGVTYSSSGFTPDFISKEYTDGISLKGEWWLNGSAMDASGTIDAPSIKSLFVTSTVEASAGYDLLAASTEHSTVIAYTVNDSTDAENVLRSGYEFNYRLGSLGEGAGTISYTINATDQGDNSSSCQVSISYDNLAPRLLSQTSSDFNISRDVKNDYGFFTFGSTAYETETNESGFSRVVVYFERGTDIYDTYLKKSAKINNETKTNKLAESSLHNEDGLYFVTGTAAANGISGKVVTITIDDDRFIHKGGLVKFGGAYYIITAYDSTSTNKQVTLDSNPAESLAGSSIYFAVGNVIDTVGSETAGNDVSRDETTDGYGYYTDSIDNSDDWMIESTTTSSGTTKWTASINSNNVPDGPIVIHYVVFDKAGNMVADSLKTEVTNNSPRLASLKVVCDYNGDGTYSDTNEGKTYYYNGKQRFAKTTYSEFSAATDIISDLIVSGNGKDSANNGTAFMTVKNKVKFVPELVGGNGALYYQYKWTNGDKTISDIAADSFGEGNDSNIDVVADNYDYLVTDAYGDSYIKGYTTYGDSNTEFALAQVSTTNLSTLGNSSVTSPAWFNFTIYDSTDGCNAWSTTASDWADGSTTLPSTGRHQATFSVALNIQYADEVAPKVNVKPFHYTSLTDNSIYDSSSASSYSDLKGHIELEGDLTTDITGLKATTKTYTTEKALGSDPKVSGIITVNGTAYDNIGLASLAVQFTTHSGISSSTTAATYSGGVWTSAKPDTAANMSASGWTFEAKDVYNNEDGHLVSWKCNIDTSKITNVAELDRVFTIVAEDAAQSRGSTSANTSVTTASASTVLETDVENFNRPTYTMDVVPYITKVTTSLSSYDTTNPTRVSRTALGHYPVSQVTEGFTSGSGSWTKEAVTIEGFNYTSASYTPDSTGVYAVTVNGISSLNNYNKNTAAGDYNMQPNGINNDILTDDVYFDVWQFNSKAGIPYNGKADNLVMKINPNNGVIGMAFSSGSEQFNMPDESVSYKPWSSSWDYMKWNALTYDTTGNTFACSVGGDISGESNYADLSDLFIGKWGIALNPSLGYGVKDSQRYYFNIGSIGQEGAKDGSGIDTSNSDKSVYYKNKNRYQSQNFAALRTTNNSTPVTNLYLAFYDASNDEIRLVSGQYNDNTDKSAFGQFIDRGSACDPYSTNSQWYQILVDGTTSTICDSSSNPISAGAYVSIGVTSDNRVVMVWYDGADLWYTYAKTTSIDDMVGRKGLTNASGNTALWSSATKLLTGAGKYCKLAVDSDNGVHIAAYDDANTSLDYIYLADATNPAGAKKSIVDSYLDVGEQLTIDVAKSGSYQIPYIGYWGGFNDKPRYAYMNSAKASAFYSSSAGLNGADNDKYTGVWECTVVPVPNTPNKNLINVGVWKKDGALAYSTADFTVSGTNKYTSSTATTSEGTCYGNGTNNGVLAFTYDVGGSTRWVETAQLK